MHERLFTYPATLARYQSAPLFAEREHFLQHCAELGHVEGGLQKIAWLLLIVARSSFAERTSVRRDDLARMASPYSPSTRPVLIHAATKWFAFMGRPQLEAPSAGKFVAQLSAFEVFLYEERGLSPMTIRTRHEQLRPFLDTLERDGCVRSLKEITPRHIDRYFIEQSENGWNRASLATLACTLRSFFRYAEVQHWCPSGLATTIDSPTLYAQESLPRGPEWTEVKALIASLQGDDSISIRDQAVVMLLAIYGLRRSEVAALRLEDLDFENELIRITRPKQRCTQAYPLIDTVGDALVSYLQHVRPRCRCRAVFLAIKAPWRALSANSISAIVRWRLRAIGVKGVPCGAHGLRHACAQHLLEKGFSFKQIGDQLGHRRAATTSYYTKVDLKGLREVAELSLGRLL